LLRFLGLDLFERLLDLKSSFPLEVVDSVVAPDWEKAKEPMERGSAREHEKSRTRRRREAGDEPCISSRMR